MFSEFSDLDFPHLHTYILINDLKNISFLNNPTLFCK